jgi:hypothetical protein
LIAIYLLTEGGAPIAPVFGLGAVITLVLWFGIRLVGQRFIGTTPEPALPEKPAPPKVTAPAKPSPTPALQLLSILQRKGRLVDFLQEDLSLYADDQIGAAVRPIHEGCKQALAEHIQLEPIFKETEGNQVTVSAGFDAHAVRLTGNIVGDPPFKGALRHRGWRVIKVDLPEQVQDQHNVVAAAEVEVGAY